MTRYLFRSLQRKTCWMALGALVAIGGLGTSVAAHAQQGSGPAVDSDLAPGAPASDMAPARRTQPVPTTSAPATSSSGTPYAAPASAPAPGATYDASAVPAATDANAVPAPGAHPAGYQKDDVIAGAEGVFGKGAKGLAGIIEKILKEQGEPIGYIAGREASGAIVIGLRYGSGTLTHKIEGQRKVYWTGPSVGFDVGGNASNVFVLVYNLYDTQKLFRRYPQGEGAVYVVGGFTATYLRRDNVVLIPIRLGVGWRLGINAGYMKFTEKGRWLPF